MPQFDLQTIVATVSFSAYLWVGLYLLSRASTFSPLITISVVGSLLQSAYFFHNVAVNLVTGYELSVAVNRLGWWTNTLPIAFWFHVSLLVWRRGKPASIFPPIVTIIYTLAVLITLIGYSTNLLLDYDGKFYDRPEHLYVKAGPFYWFFIVYLALAGFGACINLIRLYILMRSGKEPSSASSRTKIVMLATGALCFIIGGIYLAIKVNFYLTEFPDLPAHILLLVGLGLFGYAITHYDLLVEGKEIGRDFAYSFISILLFNFIYIGSMAIVGFNSPISVLIMTGLITTSHTLYDRLRDLLDKFFFSKAEQVARTEAREYASELAFQPAPVPEIQPLEENTIPLVTNQGQIPESEGGFSQKAFKDAVRRAISSLKNSPQLVKSPLLSLNVVEKRLKLQDLEDNRLNRATTLKNLLAELIERLRPDGAIFGTSEAWRYYNSLYFPYIREVSKKNAFAEARRLAEERRKNGNREPGEIEKVLEWLSNVDEDTFYKWQRRGSDTIAEILMEEETNLKSVKIAV
jgi:hypothetical protein